MLLKADESAEKKRQTFIQSDIHKDIQLKVQYGRYLENWYLEAGRDLEASDF